MVGAELHYSHPPFEGIRLLGGVPKNPGEAWVGDELATQAGLDIQSPGNIMHFKFKPRRGSGYNSRRFRSRLWEVPGPTQSQSVA
jgi:hypothetical protein